MTFITRSDGSTFKLIAHRGNSFDYPENTFAAFDSALEEGFDNFELDVQLTADGVVVVVHDRTVDRTSDGKGAVGELSFDELRSLDVGSWKAAQFAGLQMPTLGEVVAKYKKSARIHLELKSREQELAPKVAEILKIHKADHGSAEYEAPGITISSFHIEQLHRSIEYLPNLNHGWLVRSITSRDIDHAQLIGLNGIYPFATLAAPESVHEAVSAGLSVRCWGIGESEEALKAAFASGATGTTIDWPSRGRDLLQKSD